MPTAAPKICQHCHRIGCTEHSSRREADIRRGSARKRGYDTAWDKIRKVVLIEEPFCFYCDQRGLVAASTTVDHKTPLHRGGTSDRANLCGCCKPCNDSKGGKTAEEFLGGWLCYKL